MDEPEIDLATAVDCADDTVCSICFAEFLDIEDLRTHTVQVHLSEQRKLRFCKHCTKIFPDLQQYMYHVLHDHLADYQCCKHCFRLFPDINSKMLHEKKHKYRVKKEIFCSQCHECFNDKIFLEWHEYKVHSTCEDGIMLNHGFSILSSLLNMNVRRFLCGYNEDMTYVCAQCQFTCPDMTAYIDHVKLTGCQSFSCDICLNVYLRKKNLIRHFAYRHGPSHKHNRVECPKCQVIYTRSALKVHEKTCSLLKCLECNLNFKSVSEITNHKVKMHKECVVVDRCRFCNKQVIGREMMKKHIKRSHLDTVHLYKYKCVYCDLIFKHPKQLFGHFYSTHRELEPYTCTICKEKFRVRKNFTIHVHRVHKGIGFLEFNEQYHVSFVEKKSEKPFIPQSFYINSIVIGSDEEDDKLDCTKTSKNNGDKSADGNKTVDEDSTDIDAAECKTNKKESNKVNTQQHKLKHQNDKTIDEDVTDIKTSKSNENKNTDVNKTDEDSTDIEAAQSKTAVEIKSIKTNTQQLKRKLKTSVKKSARYSSDDSDVPLQKIKIRTSIRRAPWNVTQNKKIYQKSNKFTCLKCNKNCYTEQNYKYHLSLHGRHGSKKCIKCDAKFKSETGLKKHITEKHSKSVLTDTLKKVMERRKLQGNSQREELSKRFKVAIKKVVCAVSDTQATVRLVPEARKKVSVRNFIENFVPYSDNVKVKDCVRMRVSSQVRPPTITLHKCDLRPMTYTAGLRKLERFKVDNEKHNQVTIRVVNGVAKRANLNYGAHLSTLSTNTYVHTEDHTYCEEFNNNEEPTYQQDDHQDDNYYQDDNYDNDDDRLQEIPDVAEEVMLGTEDVKPPQTITVPNIPKAFQSIRIATLHPQAPFYKIVKIEDILKSTAETVKEDTEKEEEKYVNLPDGNQLVAVNPLAHLINAQGISKSMPKKYYQTKKRDIGAAISKFLKAQPNKKSAKKKKESA